MPRFFDDYSNTYLTHDSSAGRKQQRRGWKFRENFRLHYQPHVEEWRRGPMGLASAQQGFIKQYGPSHPAVPPLPPGWKEQVDEVIGITYYIDSSTGNRTWVRPGFIPPPPGAAGPPPSQYQQRGPPPMQGGPPQFHRAGQHPGQQQQQQQPPQASYYGGGGGGGGGPPQQRPPNPYGAPPPPPNMNLPPPPGGHMPPPPGM